jgi:hypothetical protein
LAFGLVQGLLNVKRQKNANKALDKLLTQEPTYESSKYPGMQLGLAQQLFNGRMAGAPQLEKNIFTAQANEQGNINRNATDSSQALALGAATQGQTDAALQGLQTKEQQNKYSMLQNLNEAYGNMIREGDKSYQDKVRKFGDLASIRGQQQQNKTNALNGVFNGLNSDINQGIGILSMGMGGGFGNLFKKGGGDSGSFMGGGGGGGYNPMNPI